MFPVALTIAGSDPSGGAGIQADLKTFCRFGVYGTSALTLITVQNTNHVARVETVSAELVLQQIEAVVSDIYPQAAKTGALGTTEIVKAVAAVAESFRFPLVVDPVMVSKHGARLLSPEAEDAMKNELLPRAALVTPNVAEAEILTGVYVRNEEDMIEAGRQMLNAGCRAVLVKGGHVAGPPTDILCTPKIVARFPGRRIETLHTHGTGCTYSAAITAQLALGKSLEDAISIAKEYVQRAIETAPGLGSGHGPVNHWAAGEATGQTLL
jgi:hydroxymethylpyrimidine/phosphomethylpyrimidine kinase